MKPFIIVGLIFLAFALGFMIGYQSNASQTPVWHGDVPYCGNTVAGADESLAIAGKDSAVCPSK